MAPAATLVALVVTRYLTGDPAALPTVPTALLCPARFPVVAVTTWFVPGVELVVNTTRAKPLLFVTLVGDSNVPPPVLLHVTI